MQKPAAKPAAMSDIHSGASAVFMPRTSRCSPLWRRQHEVKRLLLCTMTDSSALRSCTPPTGITCICDNCRQCPKSLLSIKGQRVFGEVLCVGNPYVLVYVTYNALLLDALSSSHGLNADPIHS
eukprot:410644-Amphidinium_carterae.1